MVLSELCNGYILKLRNERKMMVIKDCCSLRGIPKNVIVNVENIQDFLYLSSFTNDMTSILQKDYDIMEVMLPEEPCNLKTANTIWKRKNITMEDIKNGSIVTLRDGSKMVAIKFEGIGDILFDFVKKEYDSFDSYNNDMKHKSTSEWDIVDVRSVNSAGEFLSETLGEE